MAALSTTGVHHLRLTVSDLARSRSFYEQTLGFQVIAESPGSPDNPAVRSDPNQLYGGVVMQAGQTIVGLRPVADKHDQFDSERVGLDHLSFAVESRQELIDAIARFDDARVTHGEIIEIESFGISILSFDDPDGIHLELTAPL